MHVRRTLAPEAGLSEGVMHQFYCSCSASIQLYPKKCGFLETEELEMMLRNVMDFLKNSFSPRPNE